MGQEEAQILKTDSSFIILLDTTPLVIAVFVTDKCMQSRSNLECEPQAIPNSTGQFRVRSRYST
jgi:hypothetical protein